MTDRMLDGGDADANAAVDTDAARYEEAFAADRAESGKGGKGDKAEGPAEGDAGEDAPSEQDKAPEPVEKSLARLERRINQKQAALQLEREQRKALEKRVAEFEARNQPRPAETRPDPTIDPIGYLQYVEQRLYTADTEAAKFQAQERRTQEQSAAINEVASRVTESEQDFAETAPDYWDAVVYLKQSRAKEYEALGASPQQAAQWVDAEAMQTAQEMIARGHDPAQGWYRLAKMRGFAGNGPSKLETIRQGQEAARSLAGGGGQVQGGNLNPSSVANLKGAAFDQAFERLRAAARQAERRTGW